MHYSDLKRILGRKPTLAMLAGIVRPFVLREGASFIEIGMSDGASVLVVEEGGCLNTYY